MFRCRRLDDCGHRCLSKCHSDALHRVVECPQRCERLFHPCGHECPKLCGEACGLCETKVNNILLPCGHIEEELSCYLTKDLLEIQCMVSVQKRVPNCGHILNVACHRDVSSNLFKCSEPCTVDLGCGHRCKGTCGTCNVRETDDGATTVQHRKCTKICGRRHQTCNHTCPRQCHENDCGLCHRECEVSLLVRAISWLLLNQIRSDVVIHDATRNATRLVLRAFKTAPGPVRIKVAAPCLVQHPAIVSHVRSVVLKPCLALINVRVSAGRPVHQRIAKFAPIRRIIGLICLNSSLLMRLT